MVIIPWVPWFAPPVTGAARARDATSVQRVSQRPAAPRAALARTNATGWLPWLQNRYDELGHYGALVPEEALAATSKPTCTGVA
jgi:hypothetical protein